MRAAAGAVAGPGRPAAAVPVARTGRGVAEGERTGAAQVPEAPAARMAADHPPEADRVRPVRPWAATWLSPLWYRPVPGRTRCAADRHRIASARRLAAGQPPMCDISTRG